MSGRQADAAEKDSPAIRLLCSYSYTVNERGESSETEGDVLFTIQHADDGKATVSKQGLGAVFIGSISDDEIIAETNYEIGGVRFAESLTINRFSGEFHLSFGTPGKAGIVHYGRCRAVTKPLS